MDDTERRTAKRSRFDQTEPKRERASRFDRRSKSPPAVKAPSESRRSRSPIRSRDSPSSDSTKKSAVSDPQAAAAAAAAKIQAQINAKRAAQHVEVPPVRSTQSPREGTPVRSPAVATGIATGTVSTVNGDMYIADGDYIRDIEVNDLRNRYTLTKGSTQKMIKEETGADVTTRGSYFPDKTLATAANPPLYLHVTSTTKAGLEKAVEKINELMQQELPNLVDERRFRRREPDTVERDEFGRRKWPEEKIPILFESLPGFNLRAQVVGHGGAYVKYIQQETRCRVQIKGRGSGFMEQGTGAESDEDMYLHVAGPDPVEVQRAKKLCVELLDNVKEQYEEFKARPPQQRGGFGGDNRGGYGGSNGYGGDRQSDRSNSYGGGYGGYNNSQASPTPAGAQMSPTTAQSTTDAEAAYAAQYAQYYAQNGDPYAAYGGYEAYCRYYQQYYAAQQAQQPQSAPGAPPGAPSSAPPPPPSEAPPGVSQAPPPPPSGPPGASYNAVPPPPGL